MPKRIQRKRTKGWRMPENTTYVGRGSRYGNPFNKTQIGVTFQQRGFPMPIIHLHGEPGVERCIDLYVAYLFRRMEEDNAFLEPLRGKNLACWCKEGMPCHAYVLLKLANT